MKNIPFFQLQAKNLFHDYKYDYMQDDENYVCNSRFFDINAVISEFDIDVNDFSLMKAQHVIAKMVGFNSWNELINASDSVLTTKKTILETSDFLIKKMKIYNIDLSSYEKVTQGKREDYVLRCPLIPELMEIMNLKPNCYFISCDAESMFDDKEHIYVNVDPKYSQIRVLVHGAKFPDFYAVSVRNIGNM